MQIVDVLFFDLVSYRLERSAARSEVCPEVQMYRLRKGYDFLDEAPFIENTSCMDLVIFWGIDHLTLPKT